MKVVMVSKALVVGAYQRKAEELARQPDLELTCIVPPGWRQYGRELMLERAHTHGYQLVVEPIRWNGRFHFFHFPGLGKQLARLRPNVVHIDEEPYNLATFLATRSARFHGARPLFFTWQNLQRRYPPPFHWLEQYVFRHARHAIAGSADAAGVIRRKGFQGSIAVIPQFGVDPEEFSPSPGRRESSQEHTGSHESPPVLRPASPVFTVGYLGRLVEEKGLWVLLEAVSGLAGDWRLELFGHGPLQQALVARAETLGLADRVLFHGPIPSSEVPRQLRRLQVLVQPSLSRPNWKEQFGRALVEAMACGVPVIGSNSGEIPHVIGESGLLFPEGDAVALRDRLADLMASDSLRQDLGGRGRARVIERFTHATIATATYQVYRQMMIEARDLSRVG